MTIPVSINIPKPETTEVQLDINPTSSTEREDGTIWSVRSARLKPPAYSIEATLKAEGNTVTATTEGNQFEKVKVGTPVAGSNLPKNATVATVVDPNTITIAGTATIPEGKATLNFTPSPEEIAIYAIEERFVSERMYNSSATFVEVWLYSYDGTVKADEASPDNAAGSPTLTGKYQLDINTVMANNGLL